MQEGRKEVKEVKEDELTVLWPLKTSAKLRYSVRKRERINVRTSCLQQRLLSLPYLLKVSTTLPYSVNRSSTAKAIIFATGTHTGPTEDQHSS